MNLNFLKGVGNHHVDVVRLLLFLSGISCIGFTGYHLYADHVFSAIEFATGMGLLLAGGGGATAMKDTAVAKAVAGQEQPT